MRSLTVVFVFSLPLICNFQSFGVTNEDIGSIFLLIRKHSNSVISDRSPAVTYAYACLTPNSSKYALHSRSVCKASKPVTFPANAFISMQHRDLICIANLIIRLSVVVYLACGKITVGHRST